MFSQVMTRAATADAVRPDRVNAKRVAGARRTGSYLSRAAAPHRAGIPSTQPALLTMGNTPHEILTQCVVFSRAHPAAKGSPACHRTDFGQIDSLPGAGGGAGCRRKPDLSPVVRHRAFFSAMAPDVRHLWRATSSRLPQSVPDPDVQAIHDFVRMQKCGWPQRETAIYPGKRRRMTRRPDGTGGTRYRNTGTPSAVFVHEAERRAGG